MDERSERHGGTDVIRAESGTARRAEASPRMIICDPRKRRPSQGGFTISQIRAIIAEVRTGQKLSCLPKRQAVGSGPSLRSRS
jgi:hypothetical protein